MMGKALFMVRAEVEQAEDREAFDRWYEDEHLPDAVKAFAADRGWRCWSRTDPAVHYAFYEFGSVERLRRGTRGEILDRLVAEFDRNWGSRVKRTRDVIEVVGEPKSRRVRAAPATC